jgi:lipopolysaccharide/colanic/teichoic acid biosynthesis glycosyltransferase
VVEIYDHPFISFEVAPKSPVAIAMKHAFDVVAAAIGLVLMAVPLGLIAGAILVTMGRPVLFDQERAGLYGRRFRMLKFRTMVRDAEAMRDDLLAQNKMSGPVFKVERDPRITPLGRFLRRTSLDELPQLFNVLSGSMSLVGPRPLPIKEQEQIHGWHRRRLSMKPGITGLWQVSGRNQIDFEDWMKLELRYIDRWSLALDLAILVRTIPAVLSSRGAH